MSTESDFYLENVPDAINRRLVYHAALAVQVAQVESRRFPDLELDAVPPFRRLNFQSALLFSTYPGGAEVAREEHSGGTHVTVRAGKVNVTSLTRSHMPRSVRFQPYQETLASEAQLALWDDASGEGDEIDRLWALLVYGGDYRSPRLTVCNMTFPTPKGTFAPGTINLLKAFPDIVEAFNDEEYARRQVIEFLELRAAYGS